MIANRHIIAGLLLLITTGSFGQKTFYKRHFFTGYIVKNSGDTLFGRIRYQQNFEHVIRYIPDSSEFQRPVRINPLDVKSLKINKDILDKVDVDGKAKMLQRVASGFYQLYAYQYMKGETPENHYILVLKTGNVRIADYNFDELIETYVFDCPYLKQKISERELTFEHTIDIFRYYNRWRENQKLSF